MMMNGKHVKSNEYIYIYLNSTTDDNTLLIVGYVLPGYLCTPGIRILGYV